MSTSRILVDTNSLIVILLGLMDPRIINSHPRTSIYREEDFTNIMYLIGGLENIIVLPNIIAEVDNLLNNFQGDRKYAYITHLTALIKQTSEEYLHSIKATKSSFFSALGVTDSLILHLALTCDALITSDSLLADYAKALSIDVLDLVEVRNKSFNN